MAIYHPLNKVKFKFEYKLTSISFIYIHMNNAGSIYYASMYIWYAFLTHFSKISQRYFVLPIAASRIGNPT